MVKSLLKLQSALKRRGWVVLPVLASATGASLLYLLTTPPVYRTSAQLIVDDKEVGVSDLGQRLNDIGANTPGTADPIATQAELVRSQSVLQQALEEVKRESPEVSEAFPTARSLRGAVVAEILPATNIIELSVKGEYPEITARLANEIAESALADNIEIIRREASVVREFLESKIPQQQAKLRQAELAESNYRRSSGIVDPQAQVQQLINQVSTLELERDQLIAQLQKATAINQQLQEVTGVDAAGTAYLSTRAGQDPELRSLQEEITALEVAMTEAGSRLGDQHPDWLAMLDQQQQLQDLQQARLARLFPSGNGPIAEDELTQGLFSQFIQGQLDRQGLISQLAAVETELAALKSRLAQFPLQQQPLANFVRQRQEAETSLQFLQSKLEEARLAEAQLISSVRIIGRAEVPLAPIGPKPAVVLLLAATIGLILSAILVALLEAMDNILRTVTETEEALNLPVLGVLPKLPRAYRQGNVDLLSASLSDPSFLEPYRSLLNMVSFQRKAQNRLNIHGDERLARNGNSAVDSVLETKSQVFVVTSPFAKEGKTSVALYMAATAATLSQRTLLIDADLGNPSQYHLLNVSDSPGLTDAIITPSKLLEIAQPTNIPNLSVLTHGQLLSRSSFHIEGDAVRELLEVAVAHYDRVIIDTAPAGTCADAATISQYTDGLLLVIRSGTSQREAAIHVATELKRSGVSILGTALNDVSSAEESLYSNLSNTEFRALSYERDSHQVVGPARKPPTFVS